MVVEEIIDFLEADSNAKQEKLMHWSNEAQNIFDRFSESDRAASIFMDSVTTLAAMLAVQTAFFN